MTVSGPGPCPQASVSLGWKFLAGRHAIAASRRDVMVPSASFASRAIDIDLAQQIKESQTRRQKRQVVRFWSTRGVGGIRGDASHCNHAIDAHHIGDWPPSLRGDRTQPPRQYCRGSPSTAYSPGSFYDNVRV